MSNSNLSKLLKIMLYLLATFILGCVMTRIMLQPTSCKFPENYYLKSTSLSSVNIVDGCVGTRGYWKDTLTGEPYYTLAELRVNRYITDDWLSTRDLPVARSITSKLDDDDGNLYTLSKLVKPIAPFNSPQLPISAKCIYYTRFNELVIKYSLQYRLDEQEYIDSILELCKAAKLRGGYPLEF